MREIQPESGRLRFINTHDGSVWENGSPGHNHGVMILTPMAAIILLLKLMMSSIGPPVVTVSVTG